MDEKLYDEAIAWSKRMITSNHLMLYRVKEFHESLSEASRRFALPRESLESILRHAHLRHFKKSHYQLASLTPSIVKFYVDSPHMSIIDIARKYQFPPSTIARVIIENVTDFPLPTHNLARPQANDDNDIMTMDESNNDYTSNYKESAAASILNDSMIDSASEVDSNMVSPQSSEVDHSTSSKKLSYQKKAIRNALCEPLTVLGDSSVIRPMYQSQLTTALDSTYLAQKLDPFTGLPPPFVSNKLALDVWEAMEQDPMYGPRHDRIRNFIGLEYEVALESLLHSMNIPFETERELRERGTAKTPDILFQCPIAIQVPRGTHNTQEVRRNNLLSTLMTEEQRNQSSSTQDATEQNGMEWKVIHWVDSKAYFGDEYAHKTTVLQQAEAYFHRFGAGLILYAFGHAPLHRLDNARGGDIFVTGWTFPNTCLLPTGILVQMGTAPYIDSM